MDKNESSPHDIVKNGKIAHAGFAITLDAAEVMAGWTRWFSW